MAELVDALGSGPSGSNPMRVQVSLRVRLILCNARLRGEGRHWRKRGVSVQGSVRNTKLRVNSKRIS